MPPKAQRGARKTRATNDGPLPDVYQDMLVEAAKSTPSQFNTSERAVKRRRVGTRGGSLASSDQRPHENVRDETESLSAQKPQLTGVDGKMNLTTSLRSKGKRDSSEEATDPSSESDVAWEDVGVGFGEEVLSDDDDAESIELNLGETSHTNKRTSEQRRKTLGKAEKQLRTVVHKLHLLCILAHLRLRNRWCGDKGTKKRLKPLLTKRIISYLNPDSTLSQFQHSRSFTDGLKEISDFWRSKFVPTARGLKAAMWLDDREDIKGFKIQEDLDDPLVDIQDFYQLATDKRGSRDIGAQLFCALLRSAGVEARLVCSLQLLPFVRSAGKPSTPLRPGKQRIYIPELVSSPMTMQHPDTSGSRTNDDKPLVPGRAKRLGMPAFGVEQSHDPGRIALPPGPVKKSFRQSRSPVYWVEVFNTANQKWTPVDPLVTQTVGKPSQFEPALLDNENSMSYVIAFDADGYAKDVTRRYAKAFNAKTRRHRVEATKDGSRWLRRVMRCFRRPWHSDSDQIEDAELATAEAQEPMPKNVLDFKDHPYYALERYLRRSEALHPKTSIGQVVSGKAVERVFRRSHIHNVRSADQWYRLGRDIKPGEQPLKFISSRSSKTKATESGDDDDGGDTTGLYAEFQTSLYIPPPVVRGKVPKNAYGNLDVYVHSMIPPGAIHILHPLAKFAARLLEIDHAAAVTGFEFQRRRATAVVSGVVVANEYREAMITTITAMHEEAIQEKQMVKSIEALGRWKRFLTMLRIRERVSQYEVEGDSEEKARDEVDEPAVDNEGGGFFADPSAPSPSSALNSGVPFHGPLLSNPVDIEQLHITIHSPPLPIPSLPPTPKHQPGNREQPKSQGTGFGLTVLASIHGDSKPPDPGSQRYNSLKNIGKEPLLAPKPSGPIVSTEKMQQDKGDLFPLASERASDGALDETGDKGGIVKDEEVEDMEIDSKDVPKVEKETITAEAGKRQRAKSEDQDSLSQGSLMSHDPEDDDAEEAWI
ncbi:MAG: hypothetical protein M1814_004854 [Vezdaea aestivalis]|nr:MAG: hypothetical protein M1814_004854 [Vezdaea aestivalis]